MGLNEIITKYYKLYDNGRPKKTQEHIVIIKRYIQLNYPELSEEFTKSVRSKGSFDFLKDVERNTNIIKETPRSCPCNGGEFIKEEQHGDI